MTAPKRRLIITIDGPAGAGKTTVGRRIAEQLGYRYLDTGALYRAVALAANRQGIQADDDQALDELCRRLVLEFADGPNGARLLSNGIDITADIRTPEITMLASAVSARPVVRRHLLELQRSMGARGGLVCEGRDMGTVVFPDADLKFYLDASLKIRAKRRFDEMQGQTQTLDQVQIAMGRRDADDSRRPVAPLKPAPDAIHIDSSEWTVDAVVAQMLVYVGGRY